MAIEEGARPTDLPMGIPPYTGAAEWGSDVVVDVLRALDVEYVALNPGSSYRGLHDSLVNYGGNQRPEMILCCHEEIAVAMAHGYYKATGKLMGAIVHNVVGLMHASMAIYDAWCDRVPVLVLGGTGPMDTAARRPRIDWIHTALVQGNLVRDFTKWDDQPASVAAIPEALLRAYRTALTEPGGPVYVCFDVSLQEQRLTAPVPIPDVSRFRPSTPIAPDPAALREAADWLVRAELPLIHADRLGRSEAAVRALMELADLLQAPVIDHDSRLSFPTTHPLNLRGAGQRLLGEADVVLGLDMQDLGGALRDPVAKDTRRADAVERPSRKVISIALEELAQRAWTHDFAELPAVDLPIMGDTALAVPMLLELVRERLGAADRGRVQRRAEHLERLRAEVRERRRQTIQQRWNDAPISPHRLIAETFAAVRNDDWVLTKGRVDRLAPGAWEFSAPGQHLGDNGGGGVGYSPGATVGAALGLKGTGKLPVAIIGDGDFLMGPAALWTAAHYELPLLLVIHNNRTYYNDEEHQEVLARVRGRPVENAWIGMRLERPEIDLAGLARDLGVHGEGPITEAAELAPALARAAEVVRGGGMALVDVVSKAR
ncbi:MAG TPA: thiamine pyrophosphate-binding protein [Chloroflexota bacterium]|nr:thiamine pyrophosphate-binding protein [Chloroflexota bacterium]